MRHRKRRRHEVAQIDGQVRLAPAGPIPTTHVVDEIGRMIGANRTVQLRIEEDDHVRAVLTNTPVNVGTALRLRQIREIIGCIDQGLGFGVAAGR